MPATTTATSNPNSKGNNHVFISTVFDKKRKLVTFNSNGAIYFPKLIREIFKGCYFTIEVSEGKIILDPVKFECFGEGDDP